MTAGNRSVPGSDYRDVTVKKFVYSNHDVRKEYDSTKDAPIFFGRKAARKVEEQTPPPDDDSTSDSSESDSDSDDDWESVSESDRDSELDKPDLEEDLSDDNIEIVDMRPFKPPVIELLDDTPPPSPVQTPRFLKPSEEIITAIEDLALSTECLQELRGLPFLKRNVRRGFFNYCRARGIPTDSDDRSISISVVFKLANTELFPHEASVSWFECPLCRLHRPFQTKDMLQTHLDLDHAEVETTWDEIDRVTGSTPPDVFNSCQSWRLVLLLGSSHDRHVSRSRSPTPGIEIILPETILDPIVPPPDPLGPTARYPFLPAKSEYGGSDVQYSVRFGGPKIYDLLGTLPMEKYGILGWAVLDKEEEIFESDDIPDEHKVMHAFNLFIAHYFHGAEKFVDDYWKMIRLAAGWNALRYWLVMLMATRFLTGRDVALLLKRYERWCAED
ncbi:hypothetical protein DFH06DRAFT_1315050 [Mycena polygramma]|nr:hypothetical protein DFH06DRAFT_1315050 [Mycena polygramma]